MSDTDRSTSADSIYIIDIMEEPDQITTAESMTRLLVGVRERLRHIGDREFDGTIISLARSL